jgi:hypothetical protein
MIGLLKKRNDEWQVATVLYNGAWSNHYPTHPEHNLWLKVWGKEGMKVVLEIEDKKYAKIKEICKHECTLL